MCIPSQLGHPLPGRGAQLWAPGDAEGGLWAPPQGLPGLGRRAPGALGSPFRCCQGPARARLGAQEAAASTRSAFLSSVWTAWSRSALRAPQARGPRGTKLLRASTGGRHQGCGRRKGTPCPMVAWPRSTRSAHQTAGFVDGFLKILGSRKKSWETNSVYCSPQLQPVSGFSALRPVLLISACGKEASGASSTFWRASWGGTEEPTPSWAPTGRGQGVQTQFRSDPVKQKHSLPGPQSGRRQGPTPVVHPRIYALESQSPARTGDTKMPSAGQLRAGAWSLRSPSEALPEAAHSGTTILCSGGAGFRASGCVLKSATFTFLGGLGEHPASPGNPLRAGCWC